MTELRRDPLISFIVPVYQVTKDMLKRCLESLVTQDYQNIEIVVTFDGPDDDLLPVVGDYLKRHKNIKVIEIEHAGACAARNAGFKASSGEIISFFNSDYVAKPGMAKLWVDTLQDHPEFGFAYGAYEWNSSNRSVYWSKEFDEFELTQANYIDCGFPLWRKHVVEWDPEVKSLQDWDFWIRVVNNGVKGFYLGRDISFVAEMPRPGGLSMDSHQNWVARVKFVREKNGIPTTDMVACSIGAPFHGSKMAQMIGCDYDDGDHIIMKPNDYKALYMIGFFMRPADVKNMHSNILGKFKDKKIIIHYIGADIYWLRKFTTEELKLISGVLNRGNATVLCETELAQKELKDYGINSEIVPIPPYTDLDIKPLPEKFSCAIFLTDKSNFDKYCQKETLSIVRALPTVKFHAYGDACHDIQYPNMIHHGNMTTEEWEKFVYKTSSYLRICRHDTRPMASDEFLLAGRDVISNIPGIGVDYIDTGGDPEKMEFDPFEIGLNDSYWPDTKKKIVKAILSAKNNIRSEADRRDVRARLAWDLDKQKYKDLINSFIEEEDKVLIGGECGK